MKRLFIIATLISFNLILQGQKITEGQDGLYYGENNKPFSGLNIEYWQNGNIKIEMPLKKGLMHGDVVLYFDNQKRNEVRAYKGGNMHGKWTTWNEKGSIIAEASYKNGQKNGKWYVWDENGTKRYDMTYIKGEKTGIWYMWDENGVLIMEKDYARK
jgi:antitoxin component YwqK of YwqJK toxin-antitoxin module